MKLKTFCTARTLAYRLRMSPATLNARLRSRGVMPDGVVINGRRPVGFIFDLERMSEVRKGLLNPEPRIVS